MKPTYTEIVEVHTYYGSKLIQKEIDHCEPIDEEMVAPLLSWDWCEIRPARGYTAEIHWRIEKDGETIHSAQTTVDGDTAYSVDSKKVKEIYSRVYPHVEITDDLIYHTIHWLENKVDEWEGSIIEGCTNGLTDRTAQGYIIDWSEALVEVEND